MAKHYPNILFIMSDQHNARCVGYEGHPDVKTPNLDRMARNGVQFRRAYSASPECMPSRISFFTGLYPHTHGIYTNTNEEIPDFISLADYLRSERGYRTGAVGKWHLGDWKGCGFEHVVPGAGSPWENRYARYLRDNGVEKQNVDVVDCQAGQVDMHYEDTRASWTGRETIEMIEKLKDGPFFIYSSYGPPHNPYEVPADNPFPYDPGKITLPPYDIRRFRNRPFSWRRGVENIWHVEAAGEEKIREALANYYSLISMVDDNIGKAVAFLDELGLLEDTIIIYAADHGDFAGEHGQMAKNAPGGYEALFRIPLLFYWKGHFGKEVCYNMVQNVDLFPTVCELLELDVPMRVQGESFAPILKDSKYTCGFPFRRKEKVFFDTPLYKTVRTPTRKLTFCFDGQIRGEMYNVDEDPWETEDVFEDPRYREERARLTEELLSWLISTEQPEVWSEAELPMPPFPYFQKNPEFRHPRPQKGDRLRGD